MLGGAYSPMRFEAASCYQGQYTSSKEEICSFAMSWKARGGQENQFHVHLMLAETVTS